MEWHSRREINEWIRQKITVPDVVPFKWDNTGNVKGILKYFNGGHGREIGIEVCRR